MDSDDIEELFSQASHLLKSLRPLFKDLTGEDLDLESAVRHYPLLTIGLAAAAGAVGGWAVGRRSRRELPPPEPPRLRDARLRPPEATPPAEQPPHPLDYLEHLVPESIDRLRKVLPETTQQEAAELAKEWVDNVLEPKLKQGLDRVVDNVSESKLGAYLKRTLRPENPEGEEDSSGEAGPQGR